MESAIESKAAFVRSHMNAEKPSFVPQTNWIYYASLALGALHFQARAQTSLVFQSLCPRTPYSSLCWFHPDPSPCSNAFYSAVLSHLYSESQTDHQPPSPPPLLPPPRTATVTAGNPLAHAPSFPIFL